VHEYCKHAVVDLSITMQEAAAQAWGAEREQKWWINRGKIGGNFWGFSGKFWGKPGNIWGN